MSHALAAAASVDPAVWQTLAAPTVDGVLGNIGTQFKVWALLLAAVMMTVLGVKVIISMKGGQSLREAIQNLGVLGLGVVIIVSGAVIIAMVQQFATSTIK
ncbi:hypothetical protein ABZ502_17810 [Streptomyces abikoensis]|uniref:hypothetical protein n=1 Tax=Streptomyces abikoensis TaxID=97398 RepID=UPI0033EC5319